MKVTDPKTPDPVSRRWNNFKHGVMFRRSIESREISLVVRDIVRAVENLDAVDEHAMDSGRMTDRAAAAAGQVGDALGGGDADRLRIEQQQIGVGTDGDAAAVDQAIEAGGMAGQPPDRLGQLEIAPLAHPMGQKMQAKPGVAHIDQMGPGVGQGNHAGFVLEQRQDPRVADIEELAEKGRLQPLLQAEIEEDIDRVAVRGGGDPGDRAVDQAGVPGFVLCPD